MNKCGLLTSHDTIPADIPVNSQKGQHVHCLSASIVSAVRQAGLMAVEGRSGPVCQISCGGVTVSRDSAAALDGKERAQGSKDGARLPPGRQMSGDDFIFSGTITLPRLSGDSMVGCNWSV